MIVFFIQSMLGAWIQIPKAPELPQIRSLNWVLNTRTLDKLDFAATVHRNAMVRLK